MSEIPEHHHKETSHERVGKVVESLIREWFGSLKPIDLENINRGAFKDTAYQLFKERALEHAAHPTDHLPGSSDDILFDGDPTEENLWEIFSKSSIDLDGLYEELMGLKKTEEEIE